MIQLDDPKFTLAAMRQPDAAKDSGYEFRGVALASASRWRWARRTGSTLHWSRWRLGEPTVVRDDNLRLDRGFSANGDVVLKFDIVKKDGTWSANFPISTLNDAVKPLDRIGRAIPDDALLPFRGRELTARRRFRRSRSSGPSPFAGRRQYVLSSCADAESSRRPATK